MPKAQILADTADTVARASQYLRAGQLVALPTETVYGLAAHALNEEAVTNIFTVKGRPLIDPLIVHVARWEQVEALTQNIPGAARILADAFWPGPLTLILPKATNVPDLVTAGNPTVALRMPAHPLARRILLEADIPVAAPSANPFGYISPTCAQHVADSLGERIDWIVDGGACERGLESTIVDLSGESPRLLRPGPISPEAIAEALGQEQITIATKAEREDIPVEAPGMLARHYSPSTPMTLIPHGEPPPEAPEGQSCAWLALSRAQAEHAPDAYARYWLSEDGNLEAAAQALFSLLRKIDSLSHEHLYVETPPRQGIGLAMLDRLQRAATK